MTLVEEIQKNVIDGDLHRTQDLVRQAMSEKIPPEQILKQGLITAMAEVGRRFECNDFYIPEMLVAARAMKGALVILRPALIDADVQPAGKVVIGTVQGDLHDIGKNLVGMMLEGAGFEVIDLGVDVAADKFVGAIKAHHPNLVACSALISTTMPQMETVIQALNKSNVRAQVRVMVGGAPVTGEYAEKIGADGYAPDAAAAASLAKQLILREKS